MQFSRLWGWAKANYLHPSDPLFGWLSGVDHALDVAMVFRALAEGPYRQTLTALFGKMDDALLDALTVFAALHDLGKASLTFQGMPKGPTPLPDPFGWIHHSDEASALLLGAHRTALPELASVLRPVVDIGDEADRAMLRAAFSHHGLPQNGTEWARQQDLTSRWRPLPGDARNPLDLVQSIVSALPPRSWPNPLQDLSPDQRLPAIHGFMGLINLADWIGSSHRWFPLRPIRPAGFDRWTASRQALDDIGWTRFSLAHADDETAIRETLALYTSGRARQLRPVQARAVEALIASPPRPGDVLVLEEETGGGKTLIAYLLHALLARRGLVTGLTFCLPTRASAKAIHEGATRVYGHRYPPVLALPGYDEALTSPLSNTSRDGDGKSTWSTRSRHRFLASPVSIGTVDQVLMGTLPLKYAHLRSVAAAPNLLVVDEVHASDPYMRGLLREVVTRRRRHGGITLLMSATLGADLRSELLAPPVGSAVGGRRRATSAPPPDPATTDAPYPALWLAPRRPVQIQAGEGPRQEKAVHVTSSEYWPARNVDKVAEIAVAAAQAGARVLVIRNTVGLARATAEAVAALGSGFLLRLGGHAVCHHARYAAADRTALDQVLMKTLHPDPAKRSDTGVVAVTTQTAEQSLDVDADLLITDLVPVDVLLQRIGRLHRNQDAAALAARPAGFRSARCVVLTPAEPQALLALANPSVTRPNNWGTDRAYADTLALAATRELIGEEVTWHIPSDNRRLVEAATARAALASLAKRYGKAGAEAELRASVAAIFQAGRADEIRWTDQMDPSRDTFCQAFDRRPKGEASSAERIGTRLGVSDVRLELQRPLPSPFGSWEIAALTVPGHLALSVGITADAEATWSPAIGGVTVAVVGHSACFTYGPFGLDLLLQRSR